MSDRWLPAERAVDPDALFDPAPLAAQRETGTGGNIWLQEPLDPNALAGDVNFDVLISAPSLPPSAVDTSGTIDVDMQVAAASFTFMSDLAGGDVEFDVTLTGSLMFDQRMFGTTDLDVVADGATLAVVTFFAGTVEVDLQVDAQTIALAGSFTGGVVTADLEVAASGLVVSTSLAGTVEDDITVAAVGLSPLLWWAGTVEDDISLLAGNLASATPLPGATVDDDIQLSGTLGTGMPMQFPDNFADAFVINESTSGAVNMTTVSATFEAGEPPHPYGLTASIWAKVVITARRRMFLHARPSDKAQSEGNQPVVFIELFTGTALNNLTLVEMPMKGWPGDGPHAYTQRIIEPGTYYVRVTTEDDVGPDFLGNTYPTTFDVVLSWDIPAIPSGGWPAHGERLGGLAVTGETGSQVLSTDTISWTAWLKFTAPSDGLFRFRCQVGTVHEDTVLHAYNTAGELVAAGNDEGWDESSAALWLRATAGQVYYVMGYERSNYEYLYSYGELAVVSLTFTWENTLAPFTRGRTVEVYNSFGGREDPKGRGVVACQIASGTLAAVWRERTYAEEGRPPDDYGTTDTEIVVINPTTGAIISRTLMPTAGPNDTHEWEIAPFRMSDSQIGFFAERTGFNDSTVDCSLLGRINTAGVVTFGAKFDDITEASSGVLQVTYHAPTNKVQIMTTRSTTARSLWRADMGTLATPVVEDVFTLQTGKSVLATENDVFQYDKSGLYDRNGNVTHVFNPPVPTNTDTGSLSPITSPTGDYFGTFYTMFNQPPDEYGSTNRRYWSQGTSTSQTPHRARNWIQRDTAAWAWEAYAGYTGWAAGNNAYGNVFHLPRHWSSGIEFRTDDGREFYEQLVSPLPADAPSFDFFNYNTIGNYTAGDVSFAPGWAMLVVEQQMYHYLRGEFGAPDDDEFGYYIGVMFVQLGGVLKVDTGAFDGWRTIGCCPCGTTITDNFNRPDSTTTANPASDGGEWIINQWLTGTGDFGIENNRLRQVGGSSGGNVLIRSVGSASCEITVDYESLGSGVGVVVFAYNVPRTQHYQFSYTETSYTLRRMANTSDLLASSSSLSSVTAGSFRILYNSTTGQIDCYRNGVLLCSVVDATPITTGTYVGVSGGANERWDNFSATGEGVPGRLKVLVTDEQAAASGITAGWWTETCKPSPILDNFNRTDRLINGDNGWFSDNGVRIISNQLRSGPSNSWAWRETGSSDITMSFKQTNGNSWDSQLAFVVRHNPADGSHYVIGTAQISFYTGSGYTGVPGDSYASGGPGFNQTFSIEVEGNTVRRYKDGVLYATRTLPADSNNQTATMHGVWFNDSGGGLDDFATSLSSSIEEHRPLKVKANGAWVKAGCFAPPPPPPPLVISGYENIWQQQVYGSWYSYSPPSPVYRTSAAEAVEINTYGNDNYGYYLLRVIDQVSGGSLLVAGHTYHFEVWIRGFTGFNDPNRNVELTLITNESGSFTHQATLQASTPYTTDGWTLVDGTFTAPTSTGTPYLQVYATAGADLGGAPDWGVYLADWRLIDIT